MPMISMRIFTGSLMAQYLGWVSQGHGMFHHDLEVMSSNPGWSNLGCIALLSKSNRLRLNVKIHWSLFIFTKMLLVFTLWISSILQASLLLDRCYGRVKSGTSQMVFQHILSDTTPWASGLMQANEIYMKYRSIKCKRKVFCYVDAPVLG